MLLSGYGHRSNDSRDATSPFWSPRLHPVLGSRVPTSHRLLLIDFGITMSGSIQRLMRAIIAANPGVGVGGPTSSEWIADSVREILRIDFDRYCHSDNPDFVRELQALFILATKDGSGGEMWIAPCNRMQFRRSGSVVRVLPILPQHRMAGWNEKPASQGESFCPGDAVAAILARLSTFSRDADQNRPSS